MRWLAIAVAAAALGQDAGNSYKGKAPPEITIPEKGWINSKAPLSIGGSKGRVVWLEFSFVACKYCKAMKPTLVKWHKEYQKKGLVVIDVYNGGIDKFDAVKKHIEKDKVPIPIAWDEGEKTCTVYNVQSYPAQYLIGVDGTVVWEGLGDNIAQDPKTGKLRPEVEAALKKELEKVSKEELDKIEQELKK